MRSHRWKLTSCECPYYKATEAQKIICEGIVDNSSIHLAFATPSLRRDHQEEVCKNYEICPIKRMQDRLETNYGDYGDYSDYD